MGIFDIFKKKQQPAQPAMGFPPLLLDIPPADEAAEFAGNIPPPPSPSPTPKEAPPPLPDIEGKISVSSELPPLPPLPPIAAEAPKEKQEEALLGDIELPSPSEIGELLAAAPYEEPLMEEHEELLTFPEIPKEEEKLPEPPLPVSTSPISTSDDLGIPQELPPIDVPTYWPAQPTVAELPEHPFIFLPSSVFKDVTAAIDGIRERARQSAKSEALITLKNKEDSALNQLQGNLESIQRKLLYVDAALFEKIEA